jgi:hypothetical protein
MDSNRIFHSLDIGTYMDWTFTFYNLYGLVIYIYLFIWTFIYNMDICLLYGHLLNSIVIIIQIIYNNTCICRCVDFCGLMAGYKFIHSFKLTLTTKLKCTKRKETCPLSIILIVYLQWQVKRCRIEEKKYIGKKWNNTNFYNYRKHLRNMIKHCQI